MSMTGSDAAGGRLLVLDDDTDVGATIAAMGRRIGLEARSVSARTDFLALLDSWRPTHIALDLIMPEADGIEILGELGERGGDEIIILTSGAPARVREAAERLGLEHGLSIAGILPKPFSFAALGALIAQPIERPMAGKLAQPQTAGVGVTREHMMRALAERQFSLVYQPKINCREGQLAGFEALARWEHPELGALMPADFIAHAESFGLIDEVTVLLLEEGIGWLSERINDNRLTLAFNMAATTLTRPAIVDCLLQLCADRAFEPGRLIIEIAETGATQDPVRSLDVMTRLRLRGVRLSIDDFGIGYSSLSQLVRLPFSEVKIDKTFIAAASHSSEARSIISAIIGLARSLELETVAEGVEDLASFHQLKSAGCDFAQGYFIGRPMTGDAVMTWMGQPAA
ncbi:EAL domain-containing protein [Arsenicitalea aurantiaca]|uniref:EAL domain-containing protein n=1 Tax=Arsenicitalea aurantiaca TaxID=1783274 RepID=A0A433XBH8_9HYPH|nr:EAL domain-containing response regulator [Arsenicitalea aurantiaca]RUT31348.1 EAL domain-containing protein [Arsenicitalea aurantiaca]